MNGRMAKKVRKYSRRAWWEYFHAIREWPFGVRLRFCWQVLFSKPKKVVSKDRVFKERRPVPSH